MPNYEGQRQKAVCPILKEEIRWIAKYHPEGDLRWWCPHGKVAVEKEVVSRKKGVL